MKPNNIYVVWSNLATETYTKYPSAMLLVVYTNQCIDEFTICVTRLESLTRRGQLEANHTVLSKYSFRFSWEWTCDDDKMFPHGNLNLYTQAMDWSLYTLRMCTANDQAMAGVYIVYAGIVCTNMMKSCWIIFQLYCCIQIWMVPCSLTT